MRSLANIKVKASAAIVAFACLLLAVALVLPMTAYAYDLVYDYQSEQDGNGVSDPTTKLNVSKLDSRSHEAVVGAVLAIIDKQSGQELVRWTTDGTTKLFDRMLDAGVPLNVEQDYILREISAPDRYEKAPDTEFRIGRFGTVVIINGANATTTGKYAVTLYDDLLPAYANDYIRQSGTTGAGVAGDIMKTGDMAYKTIELCVILLLAAAMLFAAAIVHKTRQDDKP